MTAAAAIIPAYQAEATVAAVVSELAQCWARQRPDAPCIIVIDDGSSDATQRVAQQTGAFVVRHAHNRGKGAALRSGLRRARELGARVAVTLDADGQHPPGEALRLLEHAAPESALLLGVRDLAAAGAPRANRFSNGFSNLWLSGFAGRRLHDTQCGLRRYPISETLLLHARADGYGFESEVVLRAARAGWAIEQIPVRVYYPPAARRTSHFHGVRDPFRIVVRLLYTAATATRR